MMVYFYFPLYAIHVETDLIPPNPIFQHSIIPILHGIYLRMAVGGSDPVPVFQGLHPINVADDLLGPGLAFFIADRAFKPCFSDFFHAGFLYLSLFLDLL
jgi:hypothetical protein